MAERETLGLRTGRARQKYGDAIAIILSTGFFPFAAPPFRPSSYLEELRPCPAHSPVPQHFDLTIP